MKKLIVIASLLFSSVGTSAATELLAGWELWYPYQYHDANNDLVGLDIDSFYAIMKEADIEITITELPWKRHLNMLESGQMDVAMGASKTSEREDYAYFTQAYRQEKVNLVVKKGESKNIKLSKLEDLTQSTYLIGVEGGYYYGETYQQLIKQTGFREHISEVIDIEQNVTMLLAGHLDGFLVDPITLKVFVEKYQLQNKFEIHPLSIYQDDIFIMLSKKSTDKKLVNRIDAAITRLKANGKLKAIADKWHLNFNEKSH